MANLVIGTVNAQGIRRKRPLIKNLMTTDNVYILAITETRLSGQAVLNINNFNTFKRNSNLLGHRGAALLIHRSFPSIKFDLPPNLQHLECIAATVHFPNRPIIFFSYYNPPGQDTLSIELLTFISSLPNAVLLGDFNSRHTQFGDTHTNPNGIQLSNSLVHLPLYRIRNTNPTFFSHLGTSIIDHIICSEPLSQYFEPNCYLGTTITSDHNPLLVKTSFCNPPPALGARVLRKDFNNADWTTFADRISNNIPQNPDLSTPRGIDNVIAELTDNINEAIQIAVPTKTIRFGVQPLPPFIVNLIKEKRRVFRSFLRNRDPITKTEYNRLNALIKRETIRVTEQNWIQVTSELDYRNGKLFWHKFNTLTRRHKNSHPSSHLVDPLGNIISTPQEKADLFGQHLQTIFRTADHPDFDQNLIHALETDLETFKNSPRINHELEIGNPFFSPITPPTITDHFKIGKNSAPGQDGINRKILRQLPPTAVSLLANIFNQCLTLAHFPLPWKSSSTVMIPKPNSDPTLTSSYRPISLLSCIGKIFERILTKRIRDFLETNNLLPPTQFGFRPHRSTQDPLLKLTTDVTKSFNLNKCTLAIFLDIKQAFDKVWHAGLIHKIRGLGVPEHFSKLILSYLSDRTVQAKVSIHLSQPFTPLAGVPQGSVLAPLLYTIYASDTPVSCHPDVAVSMFADDTALWASSRSSETASHLISTQLSRFCAWANRWRVTLNPNKTQAILFRHPQNSRHPRQGADRVILTIANERIPLQDDIVYLGIKFHRTLNWSKDIQDCLNKLRNRANLIGALRGRVRGCHPLTLQHTYKTFIRPVIDYRAPIYATLSHRYIKSLASCERRILRKIHRLNYRYPSDLTIQHCKIVPITERLLTLQRKFTERRAFGNIDPIRQILLTPFNNDRRFERVLPRKPKRKFRFPPSVLTQLLEQPPDDLDELLDSTPYCIR